MHAFKVCVHFCEFVMRILVLLYCHQLNGMNFLLYNELCRTRVLIGLEECVIRV